MPCVATITEFVSTGLEIVEGKAVDIGGGAGNFRVVSRRCCNDHAVAQRLRERNDRLRHRRGAEDNEPAVRFYRLDENFDRATAQTHRGMELDPIEIVLAGYFVLGPDADELGLAAFENGERRASDGAGYAMAADETFDISIRQYHRLVARFAGGRIRKF